MMESQQILFHLILKLGFLWFTLTSKDQGDRKCLIKVI